MELPWRLPQIRSIELGMHDRPKTQASQRLRIVAKYKKEESEKSGDLEYKFKADDFGPPPGRHGGSWPGDC